MIWAYFKEKKNRVALDLVFVAVFAVCFYLMHATLRLVWYPTLLCAVLFLLYVLWDFYRFVKKHRRLEKTAYILMKQRNTCLRHPGR